MKAIIKTELNIQAKHAWQLVKKSETLIYVCKGLLSFEGSDLFPVTWREGETIQTHLRFFGIIPAWRHSLLFHTISEPSMTMFTQEQGGLIKSWDHEIKFEVKDSKTCIYTDTVKIKAGAFTALVWLFANILYRYRQRRWKQLLPQKLA